MQSYGYTGALWANQANLGRQQAQSTAQAYQQYAPQASSYRINRRQNANQQIINSVNNKDKMFGFGVNALAGLMR